MKLKEFCDISAGGTPSRSNNEYWNNGNIPWLKISDLKNKYVNKCEEYITENALNNSSAKLYSKGTILYTIFATIGEVAILDFDATTNQAIAGLKIKDESLQTEYLYYYLKSLKQKMINESRGVAQNNINLSILKELDIEVPSIDKQNIIIESLSKLECLIETKKSQIVSCNNLIKSQFVEMFVNKEYSKITVEDVCEKMKIGPFGSALHKNEISTSGDVFVLGTDNAVDNEFKVYEQRFITTEKFKELEKYKVAAGDIIISMMGTIGRTSVIPEDFYPSIISSHLCMLTSNSNKMDPYFLNCILILDDNISHQINMNKKGAIMSGLNLGIIKKLQIPNVPIEEQQKFLNIKNQIDKQKFVNLKIFQLLGKKLKK